MTNPAELQRQALANVDAAIEQLRNSRKASPFWSAHHFTAYDQLCWASYALKQALVLEDTDRLEREREMNTPAALSCPFCGSTSSSLRVIGARFECPHCRKQS